MKKIFFLVLCCPNVLWISANAATITAVSNGGWYTNSTWSCNCQPSNNDNVVIPAGITVSITAGPVILTGGPVITVTILGTLSLVSGGTLIVDSNDIVKVMTGGKISGSGILDAVWSGGVPIWVPNGTSINGPRTITSGSLPITLLYFKATVRDGSVLLQWASATEVNFDYYSVERSLDGFRFDRIATVAGTGKLQRTEYSYEDESPLNGVAYYRLQSVDLDGRAEIFDMVMAEFEPVERAVSVFPNPSAGKHIQVQLTFDPHGGEIALLNGSGGIVSQRSIGMEENQYTVDLPDDLAEGFYIVLVRTARETFKKALIVVK